MPLVLTRRSGESLFLHMHPDADQAQLLKKLATTGIEIRLGEITGSQARIHISAPDDISVQREELLWK
ncbi:carbon storage regulator [Pseudomonas peli]|uniref:carbon storage regulator n=1 Tax=Pseudomonas peli TaxID=592361 RepID=UPI0035B5089F